MDISLSEACTYLTSERNFYALVLNNIRRVAKPGLGTMGVGLERGRVVMYYDPEFIAKVSFQTLQYVIEHEMVHVIMDHIPRYLELLADYGDEITKFKADLVFQVAVDCADNSLLRGAKYFETARKETLELLKAEAPEGEVLPPDAGMILPENFNMPVDKSFDFYQATLMDRVRVDPNLPGQLAALRAFIDSKHSLWLDVEEGDDEHVKNSDEWRGDAHQIRIQLKAVLKKALREATARESSKGRGTVPAGMVEWLEEYLADPVVPWWELLTSRVKTAKRAKYERGIAKPNRMLQAMAEDDESIIPAIGRLRDPRYRVFYMVDTSGSMGTEDLQIARSELQHLLAADDDMQVRVMHGDCEIHLDEVLHTGDVFPQEAHGRGGTDFNHYFEYMSQYVGDEDTAPDLVIVYTDGYAPGVTPEFQLPSDVPVIWLLTPTGTESSVGDYGEVIVRYPDQAEEYTKAKAA